MPHYLKQGTTPPKRHTVFRQPNGKLYQEELVSTEGFSNIYSLVYHVHPPTMVKHIGQERPCGPHITEDKNMQHRSYQGFQVEPEDDYIKARTIMLTNSDVQLMLAAPRKGTEGYFFKNASADEVIFVHEGSGVLTTAFGELKFKYGDYIHIPRGVVYQIAFDTEDNRLFITESFSPVYFPKRYMNRFGQFEEHSPIYERDIQTPENLQTHDEEGEFLIQIKKNHNLYPYTYATHPFDFIGWDGYFYPYIFSIHNFEPITGRLHMPPPIHQTFETNTFVMCSFCPRLYDYHPQSIPAPYNHSNVDSDEVLYYVDGDFMSRNNIARGQITLHPMGIPHGPHPGAYERSVGQTETEELAVMVDTFKALHLTKEAAGIEVEDYWQSWME